MFIFQLKHTRILVREISYFYEKYGYINMADFKAYIEEKKELNEVLNEIMSLGV